METTTKPSCLVSEVELVYRKKVDPAYSLKINSSKSAYEALLSAWDMNKIELIEQFYVLHLDRGGHCLGYTNMFTGGVSEIFVDRKIVFATALKANASGIIVAHNHPSGNLQPSSGDNALTRKLKEAGQVLDLPLLEHLIVTPSGYYSYADRGLLL